MGLTYTTPNTGPGSNVGVTVFSGVNPFDPGTMLQGTLFGDLGLTVINADDFPAFLSASSAATHPVS